MKLTDRKIETPSDTVGMGIRLTFEQRDVLKAIAKKQCNSVGGIVRLAIQQLLESDPELIRSCIKKNKRSA